MTEDRTITTMGRTFSLTLEPDEDGYIVYSCNEMPGIVSQGFTDAEALANIQEAIELTLECESEVLSAREGKP